MKTDQNIQFKLPATTLTLARGADENLVIYLCGLINDSQNVHAPIAAQQTPCLYAVGIGLCTITYA